MAATATQRIDPTKSAKYPFTVSDRLLNQRANGATKIASIQLNHKPDIPSSYKNTSISASDGSPGNLYNLSISDDDPNRKYLYKGKKRSSPDACALIFDPTSQSFVLDTIDDDYAFNLRETPEDNNARSWEAQFPQISLEASDHEDTADSNPSGNQDDPSAPADPSNPYDYRHFMNKRRRTSSPEAPPSLRPSPTIHATASPIFRPSSRPSSNAPLRRRSKPNNNVPKPKTEPPPSAATDADNEDSGDENDDGGLTIDMGDEPAPQRRDRFMGAFGGGTPGSAGPRSLRSAASSVSPVDLNRGKERAVSSASEDSDQDDIVMEDQEDVGIAKAVVSQVDGSADAGEHLDGDADDDLEAELAAAMGGSDGEKEEEGGVGLGIREEESEESEEE